jgi:hypothetical protein
VGHGGLFIRDEGGCAVILGEYFTRSMMETGVGTGLGNPGYGLVDRRLATLLTTFLDKVIDRYGYTLYNIPYVG